MSIGAAVVAFNRHAADHSMLKGELLHSAGPYLYRYEGGLVQLKVEIYGTGAKAQCLEVPGEPGRDGSGWNGGKGGSGGPGIFCGEAIAIFPGKGGEASSQKGL